MCDEYLSENEKNRMYGHHTRHGRAVREESAVVTAIARSTTGAQFGQKMSLPKLDFNGFPANGQDSTVKPTSGV